MGTNVEGVLLVDPGDHLQILRAVVSSPIVTANSSVVLHLFRGRISDERFTWAEVTDDANCDIRADRQLGRMLGRVFGTATWLNYRDLSGVNQYCEFRADTEFEGEGIGNGIARLFPSARISDGDELFALVYGEDVVVHSFAISRSGKRLDPPEAWSPPPGQTASRSVLDHEFTSLRPARHVFRIAVYCLGAAFGLFILAVVVAFVVEMLR